MKKILAALIVVGALALAAGPAPTGSFTVTPPPIHEGDTVVFTFGQASHVNNNYETTLGVTCFFTDGSQLLWPNYHGGNPYIYEFNTFGGYPAGWVVTLNIPYDALRDYSYCQAAYWAILWKQGMPGQAWNMQTTNFYPLP